MRSGFEEKIAGQLKAFGVDWSYETSKLKYTVERVYTPDFDIIIGPPNNPKNVLYIESKGYFTSADRTKLLRVKEAHPEKDIRLVFQVDNWMTKRKKQRYTDWATKHGFPCAVGKIPDDWLAKKTNKRNRSKRSSRKV